MQRKKHDALSIPNLITYFRLVLIPVFVLFYFERRYFWALVTLAVSGLSDVADGYIARHYNMVTDIGKIVDPVADKLTQAVMIFCVAWSVPTMWGLLALLAVKELAMLFWGWFTLRRTGKVNSAKWYGKVCTGVLYASMAALVLFPDMPETASDAITLVCAAVMVMSITLYSRWYILFLRREAGPKGEKTGQARRMMNTHVSVVILEVVGVALAASAVLALIYRNELTLDYILSFTPENLWLAALAFMAVYALKSLVAIIYLKLLYIAAGIVFPLPAALAVNILGTALEMTLPYLTGRRGGKKALEGLLVRRPGLRTIGQLRQANGFRFAALLRAVGMLPADAVSVYLGAGGMAYGEYIAGSVVGMLPSLVITTVMGVTVQQPGSTGFVVATALFLAIQFTAAALFAAWRRKQKRTGPLSGESEGAHNNESAE